MKVRSCWKVFKSRRKTKAGKKKKSMHTVQDRHLEVLSYSSLTKVGKKKEK